MQNLFGIRNILISFFILSISHTSIQAGSRAFSALDWSIMMNQSEGKCLGISGGPIAGASIGVYKGCPDEEKDMVGFFYKLKSLQDESTLKKFIVYIRDPNKITSEYGIGLRIIKTHVATGSIVQTFDLIFKEPSVESGVQKFIFGQETMGNFEIDYNNYAYFCMVLLGNVSKLENNDFQGDSSNNSGSDPDLPKVDANTVPIFLGFKVAYE